MVNSVDPDQKSQLIWANTEVEFIHLDWFGVLRPSQHCYGYVKPVS